MYLKWQWCPIIHIKSANPKIPIFKWVPYTQFFHATKSKQVAQLSQRDRAMFRVIEYFTQGHSVIRIDRACVSPY